MDLTRPWLGFDEVRNKPGGHVWQPAANPKIKDGICKLLAQVPRVEACDRVFKLVKLELITRVQLQITLTSTLSTAHLVQLQIYR